MSALQDVPVATLQHALAVLADEGLVVVRQGRTAHAKVREARRLVDTGHLNLVVEIDGGINDDTIEQAAEAGVDCFVAGSAVYSAADPAAAVESLRRQAASASKHLRL